MGEFITRGIAIGFCAGVSAALVARRFSLTRRHPNLLGFGVAATTDAVSRDYRRPAVYEKLLQINAPLGERARGFLYSIRSGTEEVPTEINSKGPWKGSLPDSSSTPETDWWGIPSSPQVETEITGAEQQKRVAKIGYGGYPPVELPSGGPFKGTRTWEEIRQQNQEPRRSSSSE
jgi:hypothetical protein